MTTILVTGATGFIGSRLIPALLQDPEVTVRAMTRRPEEYDGPGQPVAGDVHDPDSLGPALDGVDRAYYLVHSLDDDDFEARDAAAARAFGAAAKEAGVQQVIYLGGLGADGDLSAHLRSRREVEALLSEAGVPVTVLRAGIIVGSGGISWEMTRQLVHNLPAMIVPKWVSTRTQPIAVDDVVRNLIGVGGEERAIGQIFEIGGPDQLTYQQMLERAALLERGRTVPIVSVPLLTPRLSSYWLALVTDVDVTTGRNLIDSMDVEVLVTDDSILEVVPGDRIDYDEAVRLALEEHGR